VNTTLGAPCRLTMDVDDGEALDTLVDDDAPLVFVSPTGRGYLVEHARRVRSTVVGPGVTRWALSCIRVDLAQFFYDDGDCRVREFVWNRRGRR
jgi:hypothetical protein